MCLTHLANKIRSLFMSDPRNFLLNTDYEMDKIIYFKQGDFTNEVEFPHNLNFAPLIFGVWSTDEDFSSSNTLGVQPIGSYDPDKTPLCVAAMVIGDIDAPDSESKINLRAVGKNSATTKIYYRIYAFAPPEYKGATPTTSSKARQFILNTDYNYRKLKASGVFNNAGEEYVHNLGYLPHVMAWEKNESGNEFWIMPLVRSNPNNFRLEITNNKIKLQFTTSYIFEKLYWRLYYDET